MYSALRTKKRVKKSTEIVREMLTQRGYTILDIRKEHPQKDEEDLGPDEFMINETFKFNYNTVIMARKPGGKLMYAFIDTVTKFNTAMCQSFVQIVKILGVNHALIVHKSGVTFSANNMLKNIPVLKSVMRESDKLERVKLELFSLTETQYNLTKHELQPEFKQLGVKQSIAWKEKYGVRVPKMLFSDPVRRFYDFLPGSVIQVKRDNGYISYRIVKR